MHNGIVYRAEVSGRFKYIADFREDYPCVGDNVIFQMVNDYAIIHRVCERTTELARVSTDGTGSKQLFCANIDMIFICMSMNKDFNLRKLSQFISLGYASKAKVVVLLTKSDLADDQDYYINQVNSLNSAVTVLPFSVLIDDDIKTIKFLIGKKTVVFIGASGVGKSTITNALLGEEVLATTEVRDSDDQGRHTTTHRQMFKVEDIDAYIIDTPGIRTIQSYLVDDLSNHYADILELAKGCRYRNCNHTHEPDCKVIEALQNSELTKERYDEYQKTLKTDAYFKRKERNRSIKNKKT